MDSDAGYSKVGDEIRKYAEIERLYGPPRSKNEIHKLIDAICKVLKETK